MFKHSHKPANQNELNWYPGYLEITKYFVEKGANICEAKDKRGWTILHYSAYAGNCQN